jgi:hypothetical protein
MAIQRLQETAGKIDPKIEKLWRDRMSKAKVKVKSMTMEGHALHIRVDGTVKMAGLRDYPYITVATEETDILLIVDLED